MASVCFDVFGRRAARRRSLRHIFSSIAGRDATQVEGRVFLSAATGEGNILISSKIPPSDASATATSHDRRHQLLVGAFSISHQPANRAEASTCLLSTTWTFFFHLNVFHPQWREIVVCVSITTSCVCVATEWFTPFCILSSENTHRRSLFTGSSQFSYENSRRKCFCEWESEQLHILFLVKRKYKVAMEESCLSFRARRWWIPLGKRENPPPSPLLWVGWVRGKM